MRIAIVKSSGQYWVCSQAGSRSDWVRYTLSESSRKEVVEHKDVTLFNLPPFPGIVDEILLVHI